MLTLPEIVTFGGWIAAGLVALIGIFNIQSRNRRRDDDATATSLINNLKTTVELQAKTIERLEKNQNEMAGTLKHLEGRNKVLEELFKGRDPQMQEFLKGAPQLMEMARQTNEFTKTTAEGLTKLETALTTFVATIQPHLVHTAHAEDAG